LIKKIYFSLFDIEKVFNVQNLKSIIACKNKNYEHGIHYEFFSQSSVVNVEYEMGDMYMTYIGILQLLYSIFGENIEAYSYASWVIRTFSQHNEVYKDSKIDRVMQGLSETAGELSGVYNIKIGKCREFRKTVNISENIPDIYNVIMCGATDNLRASIDKIIQTCDFVKSVLEVQAFSWVSEKKYLSYAKFKVFEIMDVFARRIMCENDVVFFACGDNDEGIIFRSCGDICREISQM
jgi:hypothetical protein